MGVLVKVFEGMNDKKIIYIKEIHNYFSVSNWEFQDGEYKMTTEEFLKMVNEKSPNKYNKFKRILEKREESLLNSDKLSKIHPNYTLCLHPSRKCNLSCKYCFANDNDYLPNKELTLEVAKKGIDFLIDGVGKEASRYTIDLAGSGEPLLKFNLIKDIEDYCEKKRTETGKDIKIMFPTNATLLDEEKVRYFEEKPNILLGVSIDGDKSKNINRVYKNNLQTYSKVKEAIDLFKNKKIGLAVTITDKNEDVANIYDHLYSYNNIDAISMQFVRDFRTTEESLLYKININNLISSYKLLANNLLTHIKNKDFNYVFTLLRGADIFGGFILTVIFKGMITKGRCDAGINRFAMDENGDLYSCSVMNGNKNFYIGDISNGINENLQKEHLKINVFQSNKCKKCWCSNICRGECSVISYLTNKTLFEPNEYMCNIRKELIKISIMFVQYLEENYPQEYTVLKSFALNVSRFNQGDSGIWAINNYLKSIEKRVTYSEICKNIPIGERGVKPKDFIRFINKYDSEINAFKIKKIDSYIDIEYPAIIVNLSDRFYRYSIVEGIGDNSLKIRMIDSNKIIDVPKVYFIENEIVFFAKVKK